MRISRRRGELRLRLDPIETDVLSAVLTELVDALDTDALAADDPVRHRLFPDAYRDDRAAADDFRSITESALTADRVERTRRCVAELAPAAPGGAVEVALDDEAGTRWITTLNDVRLALGTRLGITEDEPDGDPDEDADAPDFQQRAIYYWLTGLQDALVRALMR